MNVLKKKYCLFLGTKKNDCWFPLTLPGQFYRMLDTSASGQFGTRTLRHLCETFRHQDSSAPGQFGTCVFSLILRTKLPIRHDVTYWKEEFQWLTVHFYVAIFHLCLNEFK